MKGKTTLILLGIFVVLFALIYFFDVKGGEKRSAREKQTKQLFQVRKDEIIQAEFITGERIVCDKSTGSWEITTPVRTAGDTATIEYNLGQIVEANIERTIADSVEDLTAYGLAMPRGVVRLMSKDSTIATLLIGDENPTGTLIFVKRADEAAVYTTAKTLWSNVSKSLFDLRDKQTMHIRTADVRRLELNSVKKGKVVLEKSGDNWQILQPVPIAANSNEVTSLLNRLANGRVKNFIAEEPTNLARYGFNRPRLTMNLFIGESLAKTSFVVGDTARNDGGGFYAREETRKPVFTLENWAVDNLTKGAFDLQNKKLTGFDGRSADRVVWRLDNREYAALKIDTTNWLIVAPDTVQVDETLFQRWLEALGDFSVDELEAYQPKPLASYGLDLPRLRVTIFKGDTQLGTILVGKQIKEDYYVKAGSAPYVYRIRKYTYERIAKKPDDLRRKMPEKAK